VFVSKSVMHLCPAKMAEQIRFVFQCHVWAGDFWEPKNIVLDEGPNLSTERGGDSIRPLSYYFGHLFGCDLADT